MSAKLQGKIHRYNLIAYSNAIGVKASNNAIRTAKHLFLALAEHYNDITRQCNPSIPVLMSCIELSHGSTVAAKNLLIKLGLVSVIKNAKGGRHSCWYELHLPRFDEFSRPVNSTPNHPAKRIFQNISMNTTHPVEVHKQSNQLEVKTPIDRIQTLRKSLNISYLISLEKSDRAKYRDVICNTANFLGIDISPPKGLIEIGQEVMAKLKEDG